MIGDRKREGGGKEERREGEKEVRRERKKVEDKIKCVYILVSVGKTEGRASVQKEKHRSYFEPSARAQLRTK